MYACVLVHAGVCACMRVLCMFVCAMCVCTSLLPCRPSTCQQTPAGCCQHPLAHSGQHLPASIVPRYLHLMVCCKRTPKMAHISFIWVLKYC